MDWIAKKGIGATIKPFAVQIGAGIEWLNAQPGRKRGIAAALLGFGTSLRVLGLEPYAQALEGFNSILQGISTTTDIAGIIMMVWGLVHPLLISHQQLQAQAVNVLATAQKATPPEQVATKGLQAEAILMVRQAQHESVMAASAINQKTGS